ncbi:hypothetical protein Pcinc_000015 [Petrolisthes cinctipes]|uniref:Uncharacterized protein n=1 Tax=Petrolisthes cinctipes TaxID=88211 RepID=A0AAE1L4R2_PETCI|nr:hypothetical protein Pcinc_000015 [Petrolisthes cinctipes]
MPQAVAALATTPTPQAVAALATTPASQAHAAIAVSAWPQVAAAQRRHHHCLATTCTRQQRCYAPCALAPPRPPLPRLSNTNTLLLHTPALTPLPQY